LSRPTGLSRRSQTQADSVVPCRGAVTPGRAGLLRRQILFVKWGHPPHGSIWSQK
jgi:hypothetical protein